jgi:hypothetical protein
MCRNGFPKCAVLRSNIAYTLNYRESQYIIIPAALKSEAGRLSASFWKTNHIPLGDLDQCTVALGTVDASKHACCEAT